jgi:uncharacterized membrane protein YagU involved in acid resistance
MKMHGFSATAGNRWRRHRIPEGLREEIVPKNILMIGPTGCGKTEIARRLAKIAYAPFVKVCQLVFEHHRDCTMVFNCVVLILIVDFSKVCMREKFSRFGTEVSEFWTACWIPLCNFTPSLFHLHMVRSGRKSMEAFSSSWRCFGRLVY